MYTVGMKQAKANKTSMQRTFAYLKTILNNAVIV